MSLVLNIDTAVQTSSVCLADNDQVLGLKINPSQKDSAAWLHIAIAQLVNETNCSLQDLDAIAVSEGPGSYTGLRVGMSTAKGLCYSLNKPLITINTLLMMASAANKGQADLFCPMIDARRMEVFAALFDPQLTMVSGPLNLVLDAGSFGDWLDRGTILFFGNGSPKFQSVMNHPHALFAELDANAGDMAGLSFAKFRAGKFADLAYAQPFYGKEFHSSQTYSL